MINKMYAQWKTKRIAASRKKHNGFYKGDYVSFIYRFDKCAGKIKSISFIHYPGRRKQECFVAKISIGKGKVVFINLIYLTHSAELNDLILDEMVAI